MQQFVLVCLGALGLVVGCGGAVRDDQDGSAGPGASTGGSAAVGTAGGGTAGSGDVAPPMTFDDFETPEVFVGGGLWMGFPGDTLPIGTPDVPHDGAALHLAGTTGPEGLDVYFHTPQPVELLFSTLAFWAQSDDAGAKLTVAIGGPEPLYFPDRAQGVAWPERVVALSDDWQEVVIDFEELGIGPDNLSPHSEVFGAVHFIIEPNTTYDLWIDDLTGQPR